MRDIVLELLKLTIMIATMLVTHYLIPWLKAKTQNETMHALIDWAVQAVLAAEQIHEQKNIALSDEDIDVMIEAAVKQMNDG